MFEKQLSEVEVAFEQIRSAIDEDQWRDALVALSTLAKPFILVYPAKAQDDLDPLLPISASLMKCAVEMSLLLRHIEPRTRNQYALSVLVASLTHLLIMETNGDKRANDPPMSR